MTTTRASLRSAFLQAIGWGEYASRTPTGGGAAGATLLDTGLAGRGDDFFNGWWTTLPLGPAGVSTYETKEVLDFASSGGVVTPLTAFSAQVTTAANYELLRVNPELIHQALKAACEQIYPHLYIAKLDETLVASNLLSNWDFETYAASAFTGWTTGGSPTLSQESTRIWHGSYSAKIISAAGAAGTLSQNLFTSVNIHEIAGKTLNFKGRVWCGTSDKARLRVTFDGSTYYSSPYHAGGAEWEGPGTIYVSVAVPAGATQMTCLLEVAAGAVTAYFDAVYAYIDDIYRYTIPAAILKGPYTLWVETDPDAQGYPFEKVTSWHPEEDGSGRYIVLDACLAAGRILRLEGTGKLTTVALGTTDTGTVEVDAGPRRDMLIALAAQIFVERLAMEAPPAERDMYAANAQLWERTYQKHLLTPGHRDNPMQASPLGLPMRWV